MNLILDNPRQIAPAFFTALLHNSHIADAQGSGDFTLCIYLMKLRELYRWETCLSITDPVDMDKLGSWISERELLWDEVDNADFRPLPLDGELFDHFSIGDINQILAPQGLYYSAGLGQFCRTNYLLAELNDRQYYEGVEVTYCGKEWLRGFSAPLAMAQAGKIIIRTEAIERYLWEKVEEWGWKQPQSAMGRALACYSFDVSRDRALEQMREDIVPVIVNHELGEIDVQQQFGSAWNELIFSTPRSPAHLVLRSIGDLLADALRTLPTIIGSGKDSLLHFYFGNMTPMMKDLAPSLMSAYNGWLVSSSLNELQQLIDQSSTHWQRVAERIIESTIAGSADKNRKTIESLRDSIQL